MVFVFKVNVNVNKALPVKIARKVPVRMDAAPKKGLGRATKTRCVANVNLDMLEWNAIKQLVLTIVLIVVIVFKMKLVNMNVFVKTHGLATTAANQRVQILVRIMANALI
tara:strand:+ start:547 stop:876 length:330 start_codon:yes stop_codon:yes gene_type:complete